MSRYGSAYQFDAALSATGNLRLWGTTEPLFRQRVEAIVEAFSATQEDLDKERKAIMKQQRIDWYKSLESAPAHGDMAFTVPLFDEFMVRAIPQFNR